MSTPKSEFSKVTFISSQKISNLAPSVSEDVIEEMEKEQKERIKSKKYKSF
ncbi:hypothetical protein [Gloeothece verrucosa]|uniref:Uncharacterized protein n=1 Tax=Gloeothece verrucosa (strain PCC 7822) TaxID=497965 RepID=E0UJM9_GLOV7|nr:hypothetical protein [Gloeothece verrucosa]ADN12273.1 hypothetical protein Cyan7822_0224 [Gloeothece verrucosa PCC 7822]